MANQKLTQLTQIVAATDGDELLYLVDAPTTSPVSRSITLSSLDFRGKVYGSIGTSSTIGQFVASGTDVANGTIFSAINTVGPSVNVTALPTGSNYSALQVGKSGDYLVSFRAAFSRVNVGGPGNFLTSSFTVGLIRNVAAGGQTTPNEFESKFTFTSGVYAQFQPQYISVSVDGIISLTAGDSIFWTIYQDGIAGFFFPGPDTLSVTSSLFLIKRIG